MTDARGVRARAAAVALLALLVLPGPAAGEGPTTVSRFSDGSSEATFYFGSGPETWSTNITVPRQVVVNSAGLTVEGLPGSEGEYPSSAQLRLGAGGELVWDFGLAATGAGEMGRQGTFSGGRAEVSATFPEGGGDLVRGSLVLPTGAQVRDATVQVSGQDGPLAPELFSPPDRAFQVFWNTQNGTVVQAAISSDGVDFTGRDGETGAKLRALRVQLGPPSGQFVEDIQYLPGSDRAALLVPGLGVLVVELGTGREQLFFTGDEAASLATMTFSETYLAVAGRGFAAVKDLVGGSRDDVNSTEFPGAAWYEPVGIDYQPEGRRLVMATRGSSFRAKHVSVFALDERTVRVFTETTVTSHLAAMLLLPESDSVLLRLSGSGTINGQSNNHAAIALSLEDGALSYIQALEELWSVTALRRAGDTVCAVGDSRDYSGSRLVLLDLREGSWRAFSGYGTEWGSGGTGSWAYDPGSRRLLVATYDSGLRVYELDFAMMAGRARTLPEPDWPVPARVTTAMAHGGDLILGTANGLVSIGPEGRRSWSVDCGQVDCMASDPVSGRLVVAARDGLRCWPGADAWFPGPLDILELDLSVFPPAIDRHRIELLPEWALIQIKAIAPCPPNGTMFLAVTAYYASGLYEVRRDGTFAKVATPSDTVRALALSPDGRTLYASCIGAGLLVQDIATGRQELLTPFSETPLLSTTIQSVSVDIEGGVLVCQAPASGYFPGGVSLLLPGPNGSLELSFSQIFKDRYLDAAARDPSGRRIFVTDGSMLSVVDETGGSRTDLSPGVYMYTISWSPEAGALVGANQASGFRLPWGAGPPSDVGLDIGADGTVEWSAPGRFDGRARIDISAALSGILANRTGGGRFTEIPVGVRSGSAGTVRLDELSVTYALSERVDLAEALAASLRKMPASGEATVPLSVSATGGGLRLSALAIELGPDGPPTPGKLPRVRVDAAAASPTLLDLSGYFSDDLTPSSNLTFRLSVRGQPSGVSVSLVFGHYALIDARNASFRGDVRVSVTATDERGLPAQSELRLSVFRSGEYVPPPPYYNALAWVFGAVALVIGIAAVVLYMRSVRRRG